MTPLWQYPPGWRILDTRDFLEGRRPSRRPFFSEFIYDDKVMRQMRELEVLLARVDAILPDETDTVTASWAQLLLWALHGVLHAIAVDILSPNRLWWSICCFVFCSPMSVIHIFVGMSIAYTDRRDVAEKNYTDSVVTLIAYLTWLFSRRLTPIFWHLVCTLTRIVWTDLSLTVLICLLLFCIKEGAPSSWKLRAGKAWEELHWRAVVGVTNVSYIIILTIKSQWRELNSMTGTVVSGIWKMPRFVLTSLGVQSRQEFSYKGVSKLENVPEGKFRLLRLRRKWPFLDSRADLEVHSLEAAPPYHAVSYVWAHGPKDIRRIVLNDKDFQVRGNVHDILRRCSSYFGERLIWIDTISINQDDIEDKNRQVRQMQDIYKGAGQVVICLGDPPGVGAAMQLISELNFVMSTQGEIYLGQHVSTFYRRRNFDKFLRARVEALLNLLHHPWFERVWIIQELVLARHVNIFYGNHSMPWSSLHESIKPLQTGPAHGMLSAFNISRETSMTESPFPSTMAKIAFLTGYRMEFNGLGPKPLCDVLRLFLSWKATVRIDKIFGITGLVSAEDAKSIKELIDYNRPEEQTVLRFANHLLDTGKSLEILDLAGIGWPRIDQTLPSWVVDWRNTESLIPLSRPLIPANEYRAAIDRDSTVVRGNDEREIVVRGLFVDHIKILATCMNLQDAKTSPLMSSISDIIEYLNEMDMFTKTAVSDPYPHTNQSRQEALWRTMIGDRTFEERPAPPSCEQVLTTQLHLLRTMAPHMISHGPEFFFKYPSEETQQEFNMNNPDYVAKCQQANRDFQSLEFLFDNPGGKRRFCITENGYIGMVPQLSRVGDTVCVFLGAKVPFVLRECEDQERAAERYELVGESYIHGMMDGQALRLGRDEVDFTLV